MRRIRVLVLVLAVVTAACTTRVPEEFRAGGPAGIAGDASGTGLTQGDARRSGSLGAAGVSTGTAGTDAVEAGVGSGSGQDPTSAGGADQTGESAGEASGAAAAAGESDRGVTDTEIRVGTSATLSGATGFLGEEQVGPIDSYFQHINSQGGVNGRKLRLVTYDDRGDPSQRLANIRKLYEEDGVIAVITGAGDDGADYVTRNQIPNLVFGVTAPSFQSQYPTVYPIVGNMLLWTQEVVHGLKTIGVAKKGMRVGMIYDTTPLDARPYLPYLREAWEKIGAEVVTTDPLDLGSDCTSLVLKYRQLNIDWWDFQGVGFVQCLSAAYAQNYKPNIGWGNWPTSVAGIADLVGPAIEGVWGGSQGDQPDGSPRTKNAAHDEYVSVIERYHPNIASVPHYESPVTIGYWSGAKLLVEALKAQGPTITKAGINKWIQAVKNFDVGITPPIKSMAPNCKTGSEVVWIAQWKYDPETKTAFRKPATDYFTTPWKDEYGGECFLTRLSDEVGA